MGCSLSCLEGLSFGNGRLQRKPTWAKARKSADKPLLPVLGFLAPSKETEKKGVGVKWTFTEKDGYWIALTDINQVMPIEVDSKEAAIAMLKEEPAKYLGAMWMRNGYEGMKPSLYPRTCEFFGEGFEESPQPEAFTAVKADYFALPAQVDVKPDAYTDSVLATCGRTCFISKSPGRQQGLVDIPGLKIIGEIDPSDVCQGTVGDCWLLSAMSGVAEFKGAIQVLFKKNPNLKQLPADEFNHYTVTLYDLKNWEPVDVVVDERLLWNPASASLVGCHPSADGELWPCILEKAVAAHCGGWDKIAGGLCTHAWRILTGCKEVYTFERGDDGMFHCYAKFDPNLGDWAPLENCPHEGTQDQWDAAWPEVGGGGAAGDGVDCNTFFEKMCAWDDKNFIMAAGTRVGSDRNQTAGLVDGHAYTVLTCVNDAGGTQFDMIRLRNPWGQGEFSDGEWTDESENWKKYPEVYKACGSPQVADDGTFWMEKDEFFKYFKSFYLCAKDMSKFK